MAYPQPHEAAALLGPDGPLATALANFESRSGQQEMARAVAHTLANGGVTLVEAGTGTGKSLAYLTPAALFALQTGEKVVISTNTINLQEQLLYKDIPLLQQVLVPDLRACLVKGWRNYLCLYRLQALLNSVDSGTLEPDLQSQASELAAWAAETVEGTLNELGREPAIWDEVCAESDTCLRTDCPLQQKCFFFRARSAVEDAHILVVNHHLLFADVAVRRAIGWDSERAVLPRYSYAVLDEAHHVEHVATDFLGAALSEYALVRYMRRLQNPAAGRTRGVLASVIALSNSLLGRGTDSERADAVLRLVEADLLPALERMETSARLLFDAARSWLEQEPGRSVGRIRPDKDLAAWQAQVGLPAQELARAAEDLAAGLSRVRSEAAPFLADEPGIQRELDAMAERARDYGRQARLLGEAADEGYVFWVDLGGRRGQVRLIATPLAVGPSVREWVDHLDALVCTSATLTVAASFSYIRSRIGLNEADEHVAELSIASPFNYRDQALVGVPTDLPDPTAPTYPNALAEAVARLVRASRGRAFVLFTSYALLKHVAVKMQPLCDEEGWPLLVQGQDSRTRLLQAFRSGDSVLLGTDSFWEGVDVPGEALSCVIVTRLPFRVPDDPVVEARMDALRAQGLDPFFSYALPEAVLKFKQGFGRLIRSRNDRGVVVVCDRRIMERRYGRFFLASLPECSAVGAPLDEVVAAVRDWL